MHNRHCPPPCLLFAAIGYPPNEVRSIVGYHPVSVRLLDPPLLPCGYITRQIPHNPLVVLCRVHLLCWLSIVDLSLCSVLQATSGNGSAALSTPVSGPLYQAALQLPLPRRPLSCH